MNTAQNAEVAQTTFSMDEVAEVVLYMAKLWADSLGAEDSDILDMLDNQAQNYTSGTEEVNPDKPVKWREAFRGAHTAALEQMQEDWANQS